MSVQNVAIVLEVTGNPQIPTGQPVIIASHSFDGVGTPNETPVWSVQTNIPPDPGMTTDDQIRRLGAFLHFLAQQMLRDDGAITELPTSLPPVDGLDDPIRGQG